MNERATPFGLVFADLAQQRFPAIGVALAQGAASSANRDAFVLLEPVARLLQELAPPDAEPDAVEAHLRLLHHGYRHWAAGGWVYRVSEAALRRAAAGPQLTSHPPRTACYLQVPAGKVWRPAAEGAPPEPLDGVFVSETALPGEVAALAVFGMHRARPGFSAVAVEGRADRDDAGVSEIEVTAARDDGSAPFSPLLQGAAPAGLYSIATAGELLLLTCRLLALLPAPRDAGPDAADASERIIAV